MAGDAQGPARAVQAGQKGTLGVLGGGGVEPLERGRGAGRAAGLSGYGDSAGEVWETVRRQRGSSWASRVCRWQML